MGKRCSHVQRQRQIFLDTVAIEWIHSRIVQWHAIVDRPILDAPQTMIFNHGFQLFEGFFFPRIKVGKAHKLVRILPNSLDHRTVFPLNSH